MATPGLAVMHSGDLRELGEAELNQAEKDALLEVMQRARVRGRGRGEGLARHVRCSCAHPRPLRAAARVFSDTVAVSL